MPNIEILQVTASFLNTFGYVGVSLLMLLIAYFFYKNGAKGPFYVTGTIGLSFLIIFGALDLVTRNFPYLIITRAPLLVGRVIGADQAEKIALAANDVRAQRPFVKRENDANDAALANHLFIFSKSSTMSCILLSVYEPAGDEDAQFFGIPLSSMPQQGRSDDELFVRLQKASGKLSARYRWVRGESPLSEAAEARLLPPGSDDCRSDVAHAAPRWTPLGALFGSAFAQERVTPKVDPSKIGALLGSEDPFVRRQARRTLAQDSVASQAIVGDLLVAQNREVRIGGLDAITQMTPQARSLLRPDVWTRVGKLTEDSDLLVRNAATRAVGLPR